MTNGGCNSTPAVFENVSCGQTICGRTGTFMLQGGQARDTDWYRICVNDGPLTVTATGNFPLRIFILTGTCPPSAVATANSATPCVPVTASANVSAGTYFIFIAPDVFTGVPCGTPYVATISCAQCVPSGACCQGDTCGIMTEQACHSAAGAYLGDHTTCSNVTYTVTTGGAFEDISGTGTLGCVGDDCSSSAPLGFTFNFFGSAFTSINVGSNGYSRFDAPATDFGNPASLPAPGFGAVVAPYWDDWRTDSACPGAAIYTQTRGSAPNRRFIAQWTNICHFNNNAQHATFQEVLFENSNAIEIRWGSPLDVNSPTSGIQDAAGAVGNDVTAMAQSGHSVRFTPHASGNPCGSGQGQPTARVPLDDLIYSFDQDSPSVINGTFQAGDVLEAPGPMIRYPRVNLGLNFSQDELDGLSTANAGFSPTATFLLLFSVDRDSIGAVDPDPQLVMLGFPYNVRQQAGLNQAAGDAFLSTGLFTRGGGGGGSPGAGNNSLGINHGDAGGVDFYATPNVSPDTPLPPGTPVDDVKDAAKDPALAVDGPVFYSLKRGSPSLLPSRSGADIFIDTNPNVPGALQVYAFASQLGLQPGDDISSIIVFHEGNGTTFNPGVDQVIFTLRAGSPSLPIGRGEADIFTTRGAGTLQLFASPSELGLLQSDTIDMLEFEPCTNALQCLRDHAIGNWLYGDMNCDHLVNNFDISAFVLAITNPAGYQAAYPLCDIRNGDINHDGAVNNFDIQPFVSCIINGGCP